MEKAEYRPKQHSKTVRQFECPIDKRYSKLKERLATCSSPLLVVSVLTNPFARFTAKSD